ncbi:MAG: zinc-binding dehydrogenase [Pseudomonadota bacterium]
MKAALMQMGRLWVDDIDTPDPQSGEVLVKSLACGICGSDLHALKHTEAFIKTSREVGGAFKLTEDQPVVLGHEFCAEVVAFGENTDAQLRPGQRVCSVPALTRPDGVHAVGYSAAAPGGFGEYMVLSERLLLPVPDGLPTELAALTEPTAVGYHAVKKARLNADDVPLVIGCGPVGLAVILALKLDGIGPVIAADYSPARRALAERVGADVVVDPADTSPFDQWAVHATVMHAERKRLRNAVFFECVGVPGVIESLMVGAPREARIVVVGVCLETDHFRPLVAVNKELEMQFVLGYTRAEFEQTLHAIADGRLDVSPLITGEVSLDGTAQAFERLTNPEGDAKILVKPWG